MKIVLTRHELAMICWLASKTPGEAVATKETRQACYDAGVLRDLLDNGSAPVEITP